MATKKLIVSAVAIAVAASIATTARADALAQSTLAVTNFQILSGGTALDASAFALLTIVDGTTMSANLNGAAAPPPAQTLSVGGAGFPTQTVCAPGGTCPSPFVAHPLVADSNAAIAGTFLNGAPITGLTTGSPPVAIPLGANASTAALAEVLGTGAGNSQSGLTLSASLRFILNQTQQISLSFAANLILDAWANNASFANATAGSTLSFTLTDGSGATVFSWNPDGTTGGITGGSVTSAGGGCNLQATATIGVPPGGTNNKSCSGSYAATITPLLQAGQTYTFGISQQSNTNVVSLAAVPEPSGLALAGLALAGAGFASLRRRRNA